MGFILKAFVFLLLLGVAITVFEEVTGINITGDTENEDVNIEQNIEQKKSPLEEELEYVKNNTYGRVAKISKYVVELYKKPYAEMNPFASSISIETVVSKYLDNQLFFSEKYDDHVIVLTGRAQTIGEDGDNVYISIGNDKFYYRSGTASESVRQCIKCYMDKSNMEDENYKNIIINMRPGMEVTLVGVLKKPRSRTTGFSLYGTILIEAGGVVPERIMNFAVNSIYEKYESEEQ